MLLSVHYSEEEKERAAPARAALEILCRSNQATENISNTPRSFLRSGIAIDIVKKIAISVPSFLNCLCLQL